MTGMGNPSPNGAAPNPGQAAGAQETQSEQQAQQAPQPAQGSPQPAAPEAKPSWFSSHVRRRVDAIPLSTKLVACIVVLLTIGSFGLSFSIRQQIGRAHV